MLPITVLFSVNPLHCQSQALSSSWSIHNAVKANHYLVLVNPLRCRSQSLSCSWSIHYNVDANHYLVLVNPLQCTASESCQTGFNCTSSR
eukprot:6472477-Amphidinium_carterae.3